MVTFLDVQGQRMCEAIPPLPNTPSWSGAQLNSTGRK